MPVNLDDYNMQPIGFQRYVAIHPEYVMISHHYSDQISRVSLSLDELQKFLDRLSAAGIIEPVEVRS